MSKKKNGRRVAGNGGMWYKGVRTEIEYRISNVECRISKSKTEDGEGEDRQVSQMEVAEVREAIGELAARIEQIRDWL
jgi:hypothetical protein